MHTIAFYQSIAASSLLQINAVSDDVMTIANNRFMLQKPMNLYWAAAVGTTIERAKLVAPSFGPIANPYIRPVWAPAAGVFSPGVMSMLRQPFRLPAREQFYAQAFQTSAGAEIESVVIGIGDGIMPAVPGDVFTIRGSSTTAAVAGSWTSLTTTWENDLEGGMYQVVGAVVISANAIAHRLIGPMQVERPGGVSLRAAAHRNDPIFQSYGLGKWLDFESDSFPTVQSLCSANDNAHEIYLQVVKSR